MKHIRIPEAITIRARGVESPTEPVSFWQFVDRFLLASGSVFGKSRAALKSADRVEGAVEKAGAGDVITLDNEDHARLLQSLDQPAAPWNPPIARQFNAFFEAIENASDKDPRAD